MEPTKKPEENPAKFGPGLYEFTCVVRKRSEYNDRNVAAYEATVIAHDVSEAVDKLRTAFCASYDDFRKFWSHSVHLASVKEIMG